MELSKARDVNIMKKKSMFYEENENQNPTSERNVSLQCWKSVNKTKKAELKLLQSVEMVIRTIRKEEGWSGALLVLNEYRSCEDLHTFPRFFFFLFFSFSEVAICQGICSTAEACYCRR